MLHSSKPRSTTGPRRAAIIRSCSVAPSKNRSPSSCAARTASWNGPRRTCRLSSSLTQVQWCPISRQTLAIDVDTGAGAMQRISAGVDTCVAASNAGPLEGADSRSSAPASSGHKSPDPDGRSSSPTGEDSRPEASSSRTAILLRSVFSSSISCFFVFLVSVMSCSSRLPRDHSGLVALAMPAWLAAQPGSLTEFWTRLADSADKGLCSVSQRALWAAAGSRGGLNPQQRGLRCHAIAPFHIPAVYQHSEFRHRFKPYSVF